MSPQFLIEQYMIEFLEKKHPQFSNMPPCPFAHKERLEKRISYQETQIGQAPPNKQLISKIHIFNNDPNKSTMILYDPHKLCTLIEAYNFAQCLMDQLHELDLLAIPLHPKDPFGSKK